MVVIPFHSRSRQAGMSLVELMVSIAVGSLLMMGLATTFKSSSDTHREMEKAGRLVENGRYAVNLIARELHHTGYYGYYYAPAATPAALPDPCETGDIDAITEAMAMPVQGYAAPDLTTRADITATSCDDKGLLTAANLRPGSDVFVTRRASTDVFTGAPVTNEIYLQSNPRTVRLLRGNSSAIVPDTAADNSAQTMRKYPHDTASTEWADTHKYHTHTYFVAPCSFGTGANAVCTVNDDPVPTLKRLELTSDGANTVMQIVPLVEGVEYMKLIYGIDTSPIAVNAVTGFAGDGIPDSYVAVPTLEQWPAVVAVRIFLLIRATDPTPGHSDSKQYSFAPAGITLGPFNDQFRRHVFTAEVRPMNLAGRREIP